MRAARELQKRGGFHYAESQTPCQEISARWVDQLADGGSSRRLNIQTHRAESLPRDNTKLLKRSCRERTNCKANFAL